MCFRELPRNLNFDILTKIVKEEGIERGYFEIFLGLRKAIHLELENKIIFG